MVVTATALAPGPIAAQSTLLTAIEGSAPAPVLDPLANAGTRGLAALWTDPTTDPQADRSVLWDVTWFLRFSRDVSCGHGVPTGTPLVGGLRVHKTRKSV